MCENRNITFPSGHHAKLGKVSQLCFSAKVSQSNYTNLTANESSRQWLVCAKTAEEMEKTNEKHWRRNLSNSTFYRAPPFNYSTECNQVWTHLLYSTYIKSFIFLTDLKQCSLFFPLQMKYPHHLLMQVVGCQSL